jgi:double-stranded uracil-DNA glycosylase
MKDILPDVLAPGLSIVFCGTAAGNESARQKAYYAHPGNKFWRTLYAVGLTPRQLRPVEFAEVLHYGIGLTDLAKYVSGNDNTLSPHDFDPAALLNKIHILRPKVLAFTSKTAGSIFLRSKRIAFGLQPEKIGTASVFVLPSPSGLAQRSWEIAHWGAAAEFARSLPTVQSTGHEPL